MAYNLANPFNLVEAVDEDNSKLKQIFFDSNGNLLDKDLSRNLTDFEDRFIFEPVEFLNGSDKYESAGKFIEKM